MATKSPAKVKFAPPNKLCEVHSIITWSYAYQEARKGPWEMHARDRDRFRLRIFRVEQSIKHIFDQEHRTRIYKERFQNE
ncbi:protein phosphatase 1 regulatory subunit 15A-like [Anthonomus grandis grandis]|uniref:protein phosphatase 1 regulatory subunit 15A-like n=1 Tax=Anthonomus grandis grandis TaxID=2921223 RepID=UPI002165B120|nr:protein phosphatase 1 regulatory subunit 15A-like [Anthonomus grandis grandis]